MQAGVVERQPQPADAEGGVLLALVGGERDRLVRAGVEGADHDVAVAAERREHAGVDVGLLLDARLVLAVEEAQLGAEQADALDRPVGRRGAPTSPSATLASSLTAVPSAVRPGPGPAAERLAGLARASATSRAASSASGSRVDLAGRAVDQHAGAGRARRAGRRRRPRRGCRAGGR